MRIELYPESCCDDCGETVHNHIDCPVCFKEYASTDLYGSILDEDEGFILSCECNAKFKLVKKQGFIEEYEWEKLNE